jgi:hypothetical protein
MKNTQAGLFLVLIATGVFGCSTAARAQHFGDYWDGGSGTWNTTNTNWDGTNVYYNSNNRTDIATPVFSGAGGTVTVDESGGALYNGIMIFNSGNWTFNGDVINSISTDYQAQAVLMNPGSGNVTINNTINLAPNPTNGGSYFEDFAPGTTMTLGNINISSVPQSGTDGNGNTYTNQSAPFQFNHGGTNVSTVNSQTPVLFATNGTTIVVNGNYTTDAGLYGGMLVGNYGDASMETGTSIFKGAFDENTNGGKLFDFGSGNIILDTSATGYTTASGTVYSPMVFVGAGANLPQTLLTEGAQTIRNGIYNQGASNAIIGGSDASASTFSGYINAGGSGGELDLRAAANGTVTFSGQIDGNNGATTKDGAGTVILSHATGNTWTTYIPDTFEMKAGTTIITNTSGDAFGNGAASNSVGAVFAQVDSGAKLAGTGRTAIQVQAQGPTSEIAAGLPGQVGKLTLAGGLSAENGITMDFTLDGTNPNSVIDLAGSILQLNGNMTFNFTNIGGALALGTDYTIVTGINVNSDVFSGADDTYTFNAPAGYTVDASIFPVYNSDGGNNGTLTVRFEAVPEPSAYAMMGLGLLTLVGIRRWVRRGQSI